MSRTPSDVDVGGCTGASETVGRALGGAALTIVENADLGLADGRAAGMRAWW